MYFMVDKIYEKGVKEIILLDLIRIGSKEGCYDDLYEDIHRKLEIILLQTSF